MDSLTTSLTSLTTLTKLMFSTAEAASRLMALLSRLSVGRTVAYENLRLDLVLDIQDPQGQVAVLGKRQRILCRGRDVVVRDLVWGEGRTLARYDLRGAKRLGMKSEGSRKAVMLAPFAQAGAGKHLIVASRRVIKSGFREADEYFDTIVERPTRRMVLRVLFPKGRPPKTASLVSEGRNVDTAVPVRMARDGRSFLSWAVNRPEQYLTYSLRWSW